jgi:C1A family cysteine protease
VPTVDQIKYAIATYGPVTAGICAGRAFDYYSGGIFSTDETANCQGTDFLPFQTNHQIILVGWNDAGGYWILRNSWGSYWGEDGYMKIAYNTSHVGEGTSWVTWGYRIYMPLVMRVH